MYKNRVQAAAIGLLLLAALVALCLFSFLFSAAARQDDAEQTVVLETDLHRNQGLEDGRQLAQTPLEVTASHVVFEDRVLLRYEYTGEDVANHVQALRGFLSWARASFPDIGLYAMMMPLRISLETSFSSDADYLEIVRQEREKQISLEQDLLGGVGDLAVAVPVFQMLEEHEQEYLFYRTDSTWTARGAYYAGQAFLQAAEMETFAIDTFQEYAQNTTTGSLGVEFEERFGSIVPDRQYYYLYDRYNPMMEVISSPSESQNKLLVRRASAGNGMFVDSGADICIWDGLAENGKTLLLLDEGGGNVVAPWMVTSFEHIVYVQLCYFNTQQFDFAQVLKQYGVTEILVTISPERVGTAAELYPLGQIAAQ